MHMRSNWEQGELVKKFMENPNQEILLETKSLDIFHGPREIIQGLNLVIPKGKIVGLLGPNGAGKTTLVRTLLGFHKQMRGNILWKGRALDTFREEYRFGVGLVPQELAIYPDLSASENLAFFARLYGMSKSATQARINELLNCVGLVDRGSQPAGQFSGGMARRLNLAIGVVHNPELLILDEPTVGVDPQSRNRMLELLRDWNRLGMTIIYTSHFLGEAEILCDELVILDDGKVLAHGSLDKLLSTLPVRITLANTIPNLEAILNEWEQRTATKWAMGEIPGYMSVELLDKSDIKWFWEHLAKSGVPIEGIGIQRPRLEDLFLRLTGRALRDE